MVSIRYATRTAHYGKLKQTKYKVGKQLVHKKTERGMYQSHILYFILCNIIINSTPDKK